MRIERLKVIRYRQLSGVEIDLGDLTVLVGPNGSGKSTLLRALDFGISGPFASEFSSTNGSPDLLAQLVRRGLSEVEVTLKFAKEELQGIRSILGSPWPDENDPRPDTLVLKRELRPNQNKVIEVVSSVSTWDGSRTLPEHATTIQDAFFKLNQWISQKSPLIIPAERRLGCTMPQDGIATTPDGGSLLYRLYDSAVVRSTGHNPLFRNLVRLLRHLMPTVADFTPVLRNAMYDMEFDDLPGLWIGSGYKEVVTILGETVASTSPIVAIEEMERGMHPGLIPPVLDAICEAAKPRQVILTTHSASIASAAPLAALWELRSNHELRRINHHNLHEVAKGLGIRPGDVLDHDMIILVEGPGDEGAWNGWLAQENLSQQCTAIEVGGFGKAKHYTNETFIKHRVRRPIVCILFDGDVEKKTGGTTILKDATTFAKENGGTAFRLSKEMIENYLIESPGALSEATGKTVQVVEDALSRARTESATSASAKTLLSNAWYKLTNQYFRKVEDVVLIASKMKSDSLPDELRAVIKEIKQLLHVDRKA